MNPMERTKPCVTVKQNRAEQFLLRIHLETLEIPLHKTFLTFTQKKVV